MSANPSNNGNVTGRLAADPKVFINSDGSRNISLRLFVENNYLSRDGKRKSVIVPLNQFYSASKEGNGLYPFLGEGDLVQATFSVRQDGFVNKAGETEYRTVLDVESIRSLENKVTVEGRRARKQVVQANQAQAQTKNISLS